MPNAADAAPAAPVVWIVLVALVAIIVIAGVVVSRRRRTGADGTASAKPARPRPEDDGRLWGLHQPGAPVQRMAKSMAAGFASIDPEETSEVVVSTDGGSTWRVIPRDQWFT